MALTDDLERLADRLNERPPATEPPRRGRWRKLGRSRAAAWAVPAAAGLGLFLLYLLSFPDIRSDAYILIDDGRWYMRMVEEGHLYYLLHPHHLLYHLQPFVLYKLLLAWWPSATATLWAHRLVNAGYGAAGVLLFYRTVARLVGGRWPAAVAAAGLAASAAYWFHAALPESAAAAAFGLTLVLWALVRAWARPAPGAWVVLGLAHAFAACMRQDGLLAVPLLLAAALAATEGRARLRAAAAYLVPLTALVGTAYAAAYLLVVRPAEGPEARFLRWAATNLVRWGDWGRLDLVTASNAWYVVQAFAQAVSPATGRAALLIPLAVALGALAWERSPEARGRWRAWAVGCLAWLALRVAFYTWFDPQNSFVWGVGSLPAVWLAFGLLVAAARRTPRARAAAIACVALVAAGTVGGVVLPARGYAYAKAAEQWAQVTAPADLIVTNNYPLAAALIELAKRDIFFLPRAFRPGWWGLDEAGVRALIAKRRQAGAVYATADVDDRSEIWTDFVSGPRARFERRTPLLADAERIRVVLADFQRIPIVSGPTPTGPVIGWRLEVR